MAQVSLVKDWVITLKPQYVEAFRNGSKKYEIRTRVPNDLRPSDRLFVVQSASGGKIVLCLVVDAILYSTPTNAWGRFNRALGISKEAFDEYTKGRKEIVLLRISNIEEMPEDMTFYDLGLGKAPLWFQRIK